MCPHDFHLCVCVWHICVSVQGQRTSSGLLYYASLYSLRTASLKLSDGVFKEKVDDAGLLLLLSFEFGLGHRDWGCTSLGDTQDLAARQGECLGQWQTGQGQSWEFLTSVIMMSYRQCGKTVGRHRWGRSESKSGMMVPACTPSTGEGV